MTLVSDLISVSPLIDNDTSFHQWYWALFPFPTDIEKINTCIEQDGAEVSLENFVPNTSKFYL